MDSKRNSDVTAQLLAALKALEEACASRGPHHRPLNENHDARVAARAAIAAAEASNG